MSLYQIFFLILVYLISSIPFSLLLAKVFNGVDIRRFGDGNPGAANAWHYGGKIAGLLGLCFDISKGSIPVLVAQNYWRDSELVLALAATLAVSGHAYSLYLNFNGGKALAVTAGVFLALSGYFFPLLWLFIVGVCCFFDIPFVEGVVMTLILVIIHTIIVFKSWYLSLGVITISLIVILKHLKVLSLALKSNFSLFRKITHLILPKTNNFPE